MKIQINDQGREFVNEVTKVLHNMIGAEQRITPACHPQSNRLCQRQNRTIRDSLVKVLYENPCDWPNIIKGVLFAHRVSKHNSTKFSPFFLMHNREPTLPINVKYSLVGIERMEVNTLLTKKRLMPCFQLRSPWEQTYIKQLVKTFFSTRKTTPWLYLTASIV